MNKNQKSRILFSLIIGQILFITIPVFSQTTQQLVKANAMSNSSNILKIDSELPFDAAIKGISIPAAVKDNLKLVNVEYYGFDGLLHRGQLVVNKNVANDVVEIFSFIKESKFPVEKVKPIENYNWSDEKSMRDNNTSAFNYRFVSGTKILSMHASGLAIDINPFQNPYIKNGKISPEGAKYNPNAKGTLTFDSPVVKEFKKRGWTWGGDWKSLKDYQHFQKELK